MIPSIDLQGALESGDPRSGEVAQQMRAAAVASGFFYVTGHGVPALLVQRQFSAAQMLFDLPDAAKRAVSLHLSPTMRGYEGVGDQQLDATARPDLKESFYSGIEYPPTHPYVLKGHHSYGSNQWPQELPALPAQCEAYTAAMLALCQRLMQLMAFSLDLPENHFDHTHANPMVTLRMLRYPPQPEGADAQTFGAGAHTDWGAITVLAQDHHGGLEVRMPDGRWAPAPPLAGSFVVNLGDMVPRWTNGRYHSNPHRVRNVHSGGHARHSIPFFYSPDYEARVEPVPTCVSAENPPRYEACTVGEHLREMYARTYGLTPEPARAAMA
jgi:isopenicillin N synthase-like dioxygenase